MVTRSPRKKPLKINDDGTVITLHQSDIETWHTCGEQMRLVHKTNNRDETDAASVGTAMHGLIEHEIENGFYKTLKGAQSFACNFFADLLESYKENGSNYSRSSFGTDLKALDTLKVLVTAWFHCPERDELKYEQNLLTEWSFDVPFVTFGDVSIRLAGTSDLVLLDRNQIWDWKSAGRAYERWEKQRWAIQPTVYTYAAAHEGLLVPDEFGRFEFHNKVFVRGKTSPPQDVTVYRTKANWDWLESQIASMLAVMVALPDGPWPLNDHGALCGPKWCAFWSQCKGSFVSGETWT